MKFRFWLLFVCYWQFTNAQTVNLRDYKLFDSTLVIENSDTLRFPWSGGFLSPIISDIDLNGDGKQDLIIHDKGSFHHTTLLQTRGTNNFQLSRKYISNIPSTPYFSLFVDFNQDGLADQFLNQDGYFRINRNISAGNDSLVFEPVIFNDPNNASHKGLNGSFLYNNSYNTFYSGATEIPAIGDMDNDGDIDVGVLVSGIGSIYFYENIGANLSGTTDSIEFALSEFCWGGVTDNRIGFYFDLGSCKGAYVRGAARHGGSNLTLTDLDCNGLPDLLVGFPQEQKVIGLYNNGTANSAKITKQDTSFPIETQTIIANSNPAVSAIDFNGDTIDDFLISTLDNLNGANHKQIQYYESKKDTGCKLLRYPKKDFLTNNHIDIGEQSRFIFIDINGDSLDDILGSSLQLHNGDSAWSSIFYWKNVGTKHTPVFKLISDNFLPLPFANNKDINVFPVDFDGNETMDLVLANEDGRLSWYKNTASPGDSCRFNYTSSTLDSLKIESHPRIVFFDFNGDSLLDLLAGSYTSELNYYQNIGTRQIPQFSKTITKQKFGGIAIKDQFGNGYLQPAIISTDSLGVHSDTSHDKTYLYLGSAGGWLYQFVKSSGSGSIDDFQLVDSMFLFNRNITPFIKDINGDAKPDFIFGMITGGASLLLKDLGFTVPKPKKPIEEPEIVDTTLVNSTTILSANWELFPNPTQGSVTIKSIGPAGRIQLLIRSINGQIVHEHVAENAPTQLDVSHLPNGVYLMEIGKEKERQVFKLVKY